MALRICGRTFVPSNSMDLRKVGRGMPRTSICRICPTVPPKVEYELTELGQSLIGPLKTLANWAKTNRPAMEAARRLFDQNQGNAPGAAESLQSE
jgi:hypothetical protein